MLEPPRDKAKQAATLAEVFTATVSRTIPSDVHPDAIPEALQEAVRALKAFKALHPGMQEAVMRALVHQATKLQAAQRARFSPPQTE